MRLHPRRDGLFACVTRQSLGRLRLPGWGALALLCLAPSLHAAEPAASAWPPVAPADLSQLKPSDFDDLELDLPYYVANFHRVANGVVETGEDRGFLDVHVWRNIKDNQPYNARIMESVLTLAYFYATRRPWNPYHGSPAVRVRLEAALDFWCRSQHIDGRFPEYGSGEWNLAATTFATKFGSETLALLRDGPPIDPAVLKRVAAANRKAIEAVLTLPELYEHGKEFSNQYTNVYAGGLLYLHLHPDAALRERLERSIRANADVFQSPAGYLYEQNGPDFAYNLGTHQSSARMMMHLGDGEVSRIVQEEQRRFFEWLSYNAVLEPDGSGFTLNRGIETRQRSSFLSRLGLEARAAPPADVPQAFAFRMTTEEVAAERARRREELVRTWPQVQRKFEPGSNAFSPYAFLHRRYPVRSPAPAERAAAVAALPYLKRDRFVHQRADGRHPLVFTYVRRPGYYAAFNAGRHLMAQQRYGLGLLWTPAHGALLQTQTGSSDAAWGTRAPGERNVYEASDLDAGLRIDGRAVKVEVGARDLVDGTLTARYALGPEGTKELTFGETDIAVAVRHAGPFEEQLPLLLGANDEITTRDGEPVALLRQGRIVLRLHAEGARVRVTKTSDEVGARRVAVVTFSAKDQLVYRIEPVPPTAVQ